MRLLTREDNKGKAATPNNTLVGIIGVGDRVTVGFIYPRLHGCSEIVLLSTVLRLDCCSDAGIDMSMHYT